MKRILFVFFILTSLICNCQVSEFNNPEKFPEQINKRFVDSLNNKPIDYYLNHKGIDKYAKLFYQGKFAVSDDELTFAFLDSVLTDNSETRAFYFYIFNSVLRLSDGALSESISNECRAYLEKYPCEFIDIKMSELYSDNYKRWIDFAASEYYFENDPIVVINRTIDIIKPKVQSRCVNKLDELELIRSNLIKFIKENE